jgi:hypothetical protein
LLAACPGVLGLTSLGLDGEATDHLTGLAKPRISPAPGTLVATTRGSLARSGYTLDLLEELPFHTALGPVVIGRASVPGCVEVSGPTTLAEVRATADRLHACGARLVLVDGAVDRLGSAAPRVSDGVLLATGGLVAETLAEIVDLTAAALERLQLPPVADAERAWLTPLFTNGCGLAAFTAAGQPLPLPHVTTVGTGRELARAVVRLAVATLVVTGAVTEGFLDDLLQALPPRARLRLVIRDATVLIVSPATLRRCSRRGIAFSVLEPLRVVAVTVNPFRLPRPYDAATFFRAVADAVGDRVPVLDVVSGLSFTPPGTMPATIQPTSGG